jgi:sulfite reductase alpha subunit-like flavoprotein
MSCTILYGTETGVAEDVAFKVYNILNSNKQHNYSIHPVDNFPLDNLHINNTWIIVVSTTGEGEVPRNMKTFWKFLLRKSLPANFLTHLQYAIFGLGDSSYEKYNAAARYLTICNALLDKQFSFAVLMI